MLKALLHLLPTPGRNRLSAAEALKHLLMIVPVSLLHVFDRLNSYQICHGYCIYLLYVCVFGRGCVCVCISMCARDVLVFAQECA